MLHKVSACRDRMWDRILYTGSFDKLLINCFTTGMWIMSYCGTHRANSQPFGDWEAKENGTDKGKGMLRKTEFVACDFDLEHTLDARSSGDHRVQGWLQSSHFCRSRSDLRKKFTRTDGRTDRLWTPRHCITLNNISSSSSSSSNITLHYITLEF